MWPVGQRYMRARGAGKNGKARERARSARDESLKKVRERERKRERGAGEREGRMVRCRRIAAAAAVISRRIVAPCGRREEEVRLDASESCFFFYRGFEGFFFGGVQEEKSYGYGYRKGEWRILYFFRWCFKDGVRFEKFFFSILYANLIICSSVLIILEVTSANVVIFLISFYLFQYS